MMQFEANDVPKPTRSMLLEPDRHRGRPLVPSAPEASTAATAPYSRCRPAAFPAEAPPGYLEEWTHQLAVPARLEVDEARSLLVFRVGGEWLALDVGSVIEVVEPRPIHGVPHRSNRLLLGLANIRGELQLCISLRELLGIDPAEGGTLGSAANGGSSQRLLVVELDHSRWVFPVDEVEGVQRVPVSALENLPQTVEKSPKYFSEAVFSRDGKRVGVLVAMRIFQALERTVR